MGLGMFGMSLFWILLIVAIVMRVKSMQSSGASSDQRQEKTALDILKERYARGSKLGEIGVQLGKGWVERLRQAFVHYEEKCEAGNLEVHKDRYPLPS